MLTIALSVVAYLFTGYTIGKIANREYFDNTPNKQLGPFRKLKRLLLSPACYHVWGDRQCQIGAIDPMGILGIPRLISNSWLLSSSEEEKENYCRIITFIWPLKLISVTAGIVQVVFFGVTKILYGITQIPSQSTKYLNMGVGIIVRTKRKLLPASSFNLHSQIDYIELFVNNIQEQKNTLTVQKSDLEKEVSELVENLKNWRDFLSGPEKPEHAQIKEVVLALETRISQHKKKIGSLVNNIYILTDREKELKDHAAKLVQCQRTLALGISISSASGEDLLKDDTIALLIKTTIFSAQSYVAECKGLMEKA